MTGKGLRIQVSTVRTAAESVLVNSTVDIVMTGKAFKMRRNVLAKLLFAYQEPTQPVD